MKCKWSGGEVRNAIIDHTRRSASRPGSWTSAPKCCWIPHLKRNLERPSVWHSAQHISPSAWWDGLCASQTLALIPSRVLQIPPSSAACERNWSEFGNVHTKLRNRLTNDRVEKRLFVHAYLNLSKKWESINAVTQGNNVSFGSEESE